MSDGVSQPTAAAPAQSAPVAASTSTAPKTDAAAAAPEKSDADLSALKVLQKIRAERRSGKKPGDKNGLRLAPKQEPDNAMEIDPALLAEQAPDDGSDADDQTDIDPNAETETDDSATEDEEPPDEAKPTWAQKLKGDLAKKTERLAVLEKQHQEREQRFAQAARHVEHRIEDVSDDLKAEQKYSAALEQAIAKAGLVVPADWKRAFQAEHKATKLERQLARGQHVEQSKGVEQAAAQARDKVTALAKQFPELDWTKSPEGKAWLAERFQKGGKGMANLERDALMFVKALRYDRSQQRQANTPQQTQRAPKPAPTLAGNKANVGKKVAASVPQNEKESNAWLAARKAARGG